jgi:hypothetical protein
LQGAISSCCNISGRITIVPNGWSRILRRRAAMSKPRPRRGPKRAKKLPGVKPVAQSGAEESQNSLQQERERAERLEQDLATVSRDGPSEFAISSQFAAASGGPRW